MTLARAAPAAFRRSAVPRAATCCAVAAAVCLALPSGTAGQSAEAPEPCAQGRISSIEVDNRAIFDPASTNFRVLQWAYHAANLLHINTSRSFIRDELLFAEGDCYDPFLVAESQRLLDQHGFLAQAQVTGEPDGMGGMKVLVTTWDEWSTKVDVGATYDEGPNLEKLQITEENLLGHGIFGEFTHMDRRETRTQSFAVSTPRFFGRSDASIAWGSSRPGHFFRQYLRYPFVGETGRISLREGYNRGTDFFAYSTDGLETFSRVLVPVYREQLELSAARRFGDVGRSLILGVSFTRDLVRYDKQAEITFGDSYDDRVEVVGDLPEAMQAQLRPRAASRLGLHVGTRHYNYAEYEGLDGLRDRQTVGLGFFAGVSVAKSIPFFTPGGVPRLDDVVTRGHASFTVPIGSSLLHGGTTLEARREGEEWHDLLFEGDLVMYARAEALPRQTLFLRAEAAGGWDTTLPFQLSLGGRESVRSLPEDRLPGGRSMLFVIEDRVAFGWPGPDVMDLGMTVFSDIGRVWPGDVPYGIDSGWQAAVGFGLRVGLPSGTRNIWRADMVFPVGSVDSSPVFRLTFELNKLRTGFFNPEVRRSRRFNLGPEIF